jgi:hypothetical protein
MQDTFWNHDLESFGHDDHNFQDFRPSMFWELRLESFRESLIVPQVKNNVSLGVYQTSNVCLIPILVNIDG